MASEDLQAFLASMSAGGSRAALESYDLDALGRLDEPEQAEAVAATGNSEGHLRHWCRHPPKVLS